MMIKQNFVSLMKKVAASKKKSGQWSSDNARHTVRHEIGHAVVMQHKLTDSNWNDKLKELYSIWNVHCNSFNDEKTQMLSLYGFDDIHEMIAEAVDDYMTNGANAKTFSIAIVNVLKGEL